MNVWRGDRMHANPSAVRYARVINCYWLLYIFNIKIYIILFCLIIDHIILSSLRSPGTYITDVTYDIIETAKDRRPQRTQRVDNRETKRPPPTEPAAAKSPRDKIKKIKKIKTPLLPPSAVDLRRHSGLKVATYFQLCLRMFLLVSSRC